MSRWLATLIAAASLLLMAPTAAADAATQVVDVARTALGKPYAWGAAGPDAFDCSGLIFWAYAQIGITVPRTSQQQAIGGQPVDRNDLQPGDVVTFYPDASHAALYTGGGNVIQASTYGRPVQEVPLEQAGPFHNARRYLTRETMTLFGVDLSNNNWGGAPPASIVPTLNEIIAEGFSWIEHKCSEGNYYADPYWPTVWQWAQQTGNIVVAYHYVTTDDPAQQAQKYLSNDPSNGAAPCMLDFEANSGDINNFWAVFNAFTAAGINMRLDYIPHWYWQQIGSPDLSGVVGLVSSAYYEEGNYASTEYNDAGGDNGQGWTGYGGATPVIWQFTDAALVAGKSVDANAFKGSLDDLKALLGIGTPVTQPDPSAQILAVVQDNQVQLRGPNLQGWPQLGQNAQGDDLTVVDAMASLQQAVKTLQATVNNVLAQISALAAQGLKVAAPAVLGGALGAVSPNVDATAQSVSDKLDGVDGNGNELPFRKAAMFYEANLLGLSKDYAFPEGANTSPSMEDQSTSLAKLLTRKHTLADGNQYDLWDAVMTIAKSIVAANPHINDDEPNSVNHKASS